MMAGAVDGAVAGSMIGDTMNLLKTIARSGWRRMALGGIVSGGLVYGLVHGSPGMVWIAVAAAVVSGAVRSRPCNRPAEAVVEAIMIAALGSLMIPVLDSPKRWESDAPRWMMVCGRLVLGTMGGLVVGCLVGGLGRHVRDEDAAALHGASGAGKKNDGEVVDETGGH